VTSSRCARCRVRSPRAEPAASLLPLRGGFFLAGSAVPLCGLAHPRALRPHTPPPSILPAAECPASCGAITPLRPRRIDYPPPAVRLATRSRKRGIVPRLRRLGVSL